MIKGVCHNYWHTPFLHLSCHSERSEESHRDFLGILRCDRMTNGVLQTPSCFLCLDSNSSAPIPVDSPTSWSQGTHRCRRGAHAPVGDQIRRPS